MSFTSKNADRFSTARLCSVAVSFLRSLFLAAMVGAISACNSGPSCSDAAAVQAIQKMAGEKIDDTLFARPELIEPAKRGAAMSIANIRTDKDDPETGARRCSATLRAEVPAELGRELKGPAAKGFPGLGQLLQEVTVGDDHIEAEIKYRLRSSDDHQSTRIEAANLESVANVVVALAAMGAYTPSSKESAPQTVAPQPPAPAQTPNVAVAPAALAEPAPAAAADPASVPTVPATSSDTVQQPPATPSVRRYKTALGKMVWEASFDCEYASTKAEDMICQNQALAQADVDMVTAYKQALQRAADRDALKREQRAWRQNVRDKCADEQCLTAAYRARTAALSR